MGGPIHQIPVIYFGRHYVRTGTTFGCVREELRVAHRGLGFHSVKY